MKKFFIKRKNNNVKKTRYKESALILNYIINNGKKLKIYKINNENWIGIHPRYLKEIISKHKYIKTLQFMTEINIIKRTRIWTKSSPERAIIILDDKKAKEIIKNYS